MKRREKFYRAPPKRCPATGKRCIPEHEVERAVHAMQTRNYARAYLCEHCDSHHLTHVPVEVAVEAYWRSDEESDEETEAGDRLGQEAD